MGRLLVHFRTRHQRHSRRPTLSPSSSIIASRLPGLSSCPLCRCFSSKSTSIGACRKHSYRSVSGIVFDPSIRHALPSVPLDRVQPESRSSRKTHILEEVVCDDCSLKVQGVACGTWTRGKRLWGGVSPRSSCNTRSASFFVSLAIVLPKKKKKSKTRAGRFTQSWQRRKKKATRSLSLFFQNRLRLITQTGRWIE